MLKKIFKIISNETQEVEGVETWVVCWERRYGEFSSDVEKCYQAFTDKEMALQLKRSLDNAFKLIGTTSGNKVTIKNQSVGL